MCWYNYKHINLGFILKIAVLRRLNGFTVSTYLLVVADKKWGALAGVPVVDSSEGVAELYRWHRQVRGPCS